MTSKAKILMLGNLNHVLNVCFFLARFFSPPVEQMWTKNVQRISFISLNINSVSEPT